MDTTQLLKGVLDLAVLAVVDDEDGYGYDIVRRLRDRGLEDVGDASVYGTLRRLYAAGALTSYVVASETGPHRKYYGITPARADPARAADGRLVVVLATVTSILQGVRHDRAPATTHESARPPAPGPDPAGRARLRHARSASASTT